MKANQIDMKNYIQIIQSIIPDFNAEQIALPFKELHIDSIDLVTIRVEFENLIGESISDTQWLNFNSLLEIVNYCQTINNGEASEEHINNRLTEKKKIRINMPQMAIESLSENWLFKEIGDIHWDLLCKGLNTTSLHLKDELENRLYATFVRITISSAIALNQFIENDEIEISSGIKRFGQGMYFSDISINSLAGNLEAKLMTSFSIRNDTDNKKLVKSQPHSSQNLITEHASMPEFGNHYRLIKKGELKEIVLAKHIFPIIDSVIFETIYELNPYYDLNGVGLLYFAAYPIINNVCEAKFFNKSADNRWETSYHTMARDILYFANCNIDDRIHYVLHSYEFLGDGQVKINSSLYRDSDNTLMARVFTIKKKK